MPHNPCVHLYIHSSIFSFIHQSIHPFICQFTHSFISSSVRGRPSMQPERTIAFCGFRDAGPWSGNESRACVRYLCPQPCLCSVHKRQHDPSRFSDEQSSPSHQTPLVVSQPNTAVLQMSSSCCTCNHRAQQHKCCSLKECNGVFCV